MQYHVDYSDSQLSEDEYNELMMRLAKEKAIEEKQGRELRKKMYSFRFVGGVC